MSFWDDAACKDNTTVDFTSKAHVSAALALCARCPIMLRCREWADTTDDYVSVLGGEDPSARRARQQLEQKRRGQPS